MEVTGWQVSDNIFNHFSNLEKIFKRESKQQFANMLNDMAFTYRDIAPRILATRYTIRNSNWVKKNFYIQKKATPSGNILDMAAIITSNKLAGINSRFSGWTEELGEQNTRSTFYTMKARGGSAQGTVNRKYVPKKSDSSFYPNIDQTPLASLPNNRKIKALFKAVQSERKWAYKAGKDGSYKTSRIKGTALREGAYSMMSTPLFFMTGRSGVKSLFHFANDDVFSGKIESIKVYKKPRNVRMWLWDIETIERVMIYFQDDYILQKYIAPIIGI